MNRRQYSKAKLNGDSRPPGYKAITFRQLHSPKPGASSALLNQTGSIEGEVCMRYHRFSSLTLRFLTTIVLGHGLALAQSQANTGTIEGIVNDPSGRAVAGAQVTATNVGTNFTRTLTTDTEGRFRALLLPLGPYKVTVKASNFG